MKKIIFTVAAVFAFGIANAQEKAASSYGFAKGEMFLEGSIKFSTGDTQDDYFGFNPKFGYYLSDKLAIGVDLSIASKKVNVVGSNGLEKSSNFGIGGFARYTILELAEKRFSTYAEFGLGFNSNKSEYIDDFNPLTDDSVTDGSLKANITVGLNYFITKKLAARFTLADVLTYNNESPETGDSTSDFQVNINLFNNIFAQPQFGLLYNF